jgi:hypothetical protein
MILNSFWKYVVQFLVLDIIYKTSILNNNSWTFYYNACQPVSNIIKRFIKIKSSRSPEAELHDFYNNIKKYITLQFYLTEDKNTEVKYYKCRIKKL